MRSINTKSSSRLLTWVGAVSLASLLSACAVQQPYGYDNRYDQRQPAPGYGQGQGGYNNSAPNGATEYGTVSNIEGMQRSYQRSGTSGVGAILGAVVGGVLGNQIGGGFGRAAATAAGAAAGAYAGNTIEERNAPRGETGGLYRIIIQLQNGGQRVYDVPDPGDLRPGDRVRMIDGQISRY